MPRMRVLLMFLQIPRRAPANKGRRERQNDSPVIIANIIENRSNFEGGGSLFGAPAIVRTLIGQ